MKVLVVGDGHSKIHEVPVVDALKKLGHTTDCLYWSSYFYNENLVMRIWLKIQNKFLFGPSIKKLNRNLLAKATYMNPALIFIYRGTHILPCTLKKLKRDLPCCQIFGYNNDDPYAPGQPIFYWRHFTNCLPHYDLVFAYRHHNLEEFTRAGAKRVELLRSWFIPEVNKPYLLSDQERDVYECDVVFVGHYEDDGRITYLENIVTAGYKLKLYGPPDEWNKLLSRSKILKHLAPIHLIWGSEYSKAISAAKIALCFLSKLNRDTYTRRCFEIPAIGTMLLSEYSKDISTLFAEGSEADFFRSAEEMIIKIKTYLEDDKLRVRIAKLGKERVYRDGNDVSSRMIFVLSHVQNDSKSV
jgi:spore maturation protein CgeB